MEAVDKDGKTPLYNICIDTSKTDEETLASIEQYKNIKEVINKQVETPSRMKRFIGRSDISLAGYDIGDTPLHAAIRSNKPEVVKKLLDLGADPNIANLEGNTAMHAAAESLNPEIIEYLLKAGARTDLANKDFDTPEMILADIEQDNNLTDVAENIGKIKDTLNSPKEDKSLIKRMFKFFAGNKKPENKAEDLVEIDSSALKASLSDNNKTPPAYDPSAFEHEPQGRRGKEAPPVYDPTAIYSDLAKTDSAGSSSDSNKENEPHNSSKSKMIASLSDSSSSLHSSPYTPGNSARGNKKPMLRS